MSKSTGKVGSYAISSIDFDSWADSKMTVAPQKPRKMRSTKEIVNKIFAECAESIEDKYWIDKFKAASHGKFPRYFTYSDGILTYRKNTRSSTLQVSENAYEAAFECMEFFRVNGGLFSPTDAQYATQLQQTRSQIEQPPLTWENANKKLQECLLSYFVMDTKDEKQLNKTEVEQLRQVFRAGISNKFFTKSNIHIEGNRIKKVDGLLWDKEKRIFYVDPKLKPATSRNYSRSKDDDDDSPQSEYKDLVPQFNARWSKYVEHVDAALKCYTSTKPTGQKRKTKENNDPTCESPMSSTFTDDY